MRRVLGHKRKQTEGEFLRVYEDIDSYVSADELWGEVAVAAKRLRREIERAGWERVAFAWSGGKDSAALRLVCEAAGVSKACIVLAQPSLEYPAFLSWLRINGWSDLDVVERPYGIEWLAANPGELFPRTGARASRWYKRIQQTGQAHYYRERKLDAIFLGRRWQDGNYTGGGGGETTYTANGVTRHSPIADWSHELCLAAMASYGPSRTPPFYHWLRGFKVGTGPWAKRQGIRDLSQGWRELWEIDPSIVRLAARYDLPGAKVAEKTHS